MKNRAVKIGIVASILPHLFCCVLPMVLAVIGLFAPEFAHTHFIPDTAEIWLFIFSGAMLVLSWILVLRDCRCSCDHCADAKHQRIQKVIVAVITVIFILTTIMHIFSHHH